MFDGYDIDSCSEESTSSSSSDDSEDEVVPSIPASLPIIKNNGQVYTYPDGKAGMGQYMSVQSKQPADVASCNLKHQEIKCVHSVWQLHVRCVEWSGYVMLFIPKPSDSAVYPVPGVIPQIPKKPASLQDSRLAR